MELPPEQAGMSGLLDPKDDQQVKVAMDQISGSDMNLLENATTSTEPTEKTTEKATEKTTKKK